MKTQTQQLNKLSTNFFEENIFIKKTDFNIENIMKFIKENTSEWDKIGNKSLKLSFLFGGFIGSLFTIFFIFNIARDDFWIKVFLSGFVGTMMFMAGGLISASFNLFFREKKPLKAMRLLKSKKEFFFNQLAKELENKDNQAQILLYLTQVENHPLNDYRYKSSYTDMRNHLLVLFHDNEFIKAQKYIVDHINTLWQVEDLIRTKTTKIEKVKNYTEILEKKHNVRLTSECYTKNNTF